MLISRQLRAIFSSPAYEWRRSASSAFDVLSRTPHNADATLVDIISKHMRNPVLPSCHSLIIIRLGLLRDRQGDSLASRLSGGSRIEDLLAISRTKAEIQRSAHLVVVVRAPSVAVGILDSQVPDLCDVKVALFSQPFHRVVRLSPPSFGEEDCQSLQHVSAQCERLGRRRMSRPVDDLFGADE